MKLEIRLLLALALGVGSIYARADIMPGVDWHVANAEVIEVVQVEMPISAEAFPPPPGRQRVWVKEVLKGVDTAQEFLIPKGTLKPGQTALVLFQYEPAANYEPALQASPKAQPGISVWPMDSAGNVDTHGVPAQPRSGPVVEGETNEIINFDLIKRDIATSTPEQVGLNRQVLDTLLFPEAFKALASQDVRRATYVRFTLAILDLDRDVPSLARLLESQDQTVRTAALKRLEALTGTHNPTPKDEGPRSFQEWAQTWAKQAVSNQLLRWPPLPSTLKMPPDTFPEGLLQALQRNDADAFAGAFAAWLDSGVMRDREIYFAETLGRKIVDDSNLTDAIGYLPPVHRLRPDLVLDTNLPAVDRMSAIALLAQLWHYDRFARERAEAKAVVSAAPPDSDILRRAAFWELRDANIQTTGWVALSRLAQGGGDDSTQRFVLGLCLDHLDDNALDVARVEIKAGRQTFIDGLFDFLGTHRDRTAQWIGRLLCQEGQQRVIPAMLTWLKDNEAQVRKAGAFNLCWLPSAGSVSNLLDAIHSESDTAVKGQMLVALAQTGDARGLETLLAAAREPSDPEVAAQIVRGLGRIRDPKALTTLADIVSGLAWIAADGSEPDNSKAPVSSWYLLSDAVNAFGYISHLFEAHAPDHFWGNSAINPAQLRLGIARIEEWRKSPAGRP